MGAPIPAASSHVVNLISVFDAIAIRVREKVQPDIPVRTSDRMSVRESEVMTQLMDRRVQYFRSAVYPSLGRVAVQLPSTDAGNAQKSACVLRECEDHAPISVNIDASRKRHGLSVRRYGCRFADVHAYRKCEPSIYIPGQPGLLKRALLNKCIH